MNPTPRSAGHAGRSAPRLRALALCSLFAVLANLLPAALPDGFVINGDGTFTYTDPDTVNGPGPNGSHDNSFTGVILAPEGEGPFPAVIINHGQGGSVVGYSQPVAEDMVPWGLVAICPTLTHRGGAGIDESGAGSGDSPANRERGQICYAVLLELAYVDPDRIAIWGHSKGAYATIGMAAVIGSGLKAGGISAGGCTIGGNSEMQAAPTDTQADPVVTPFLMYHGTVDNSVPPAFSENFVDVLTANSVANDRQTFDTSGLTDPNLRHNLHQTPAFYAVMLDGFRDWLMTHGVLDALVETCTADGTDAGYDGYTTASGFVSSSGTGGTGVRAGEGTSSNQQKAIISVNTSAVPDGATIVGATLRLRQGTSGSAFSTLGPCTVDITSGNFGAAAALQSDDFSDATGVAVNVGTVTDVGNGNWLELALDAAALSQINKTGTTQLRLQFANSTSSSTQVGWYSAETSGSEPQLVISYQP